MSGDHEFLVSGNHPGRNLASLCRNSRALGGVGLIIEFKAQPCRRLTDSPPDLGRVLPDAGSENESIDTAKNSCQRAYFFCDLVDEVIHRQASFWLGLLEQHFHVISDAGNA